MPRSAPADELVVVHTYNYRHEAELARAVLEAHAVEAIISADDSGGVQPRLAKGAGGVRLLVWRSDELKAKEALG